MNKFLETILNIYKIVELRERIILTLGMLLVYRIGAQVVLPGIDPVQLSELTNRTGGGGLLGILNAFTGGAFANASVFALGIMPYISASIVVQLMGIAVPYLQKLQKEGESGRKKITQITRWLTILICVIQAPAYLFGLSALGVPDSAFVLGRGPQFIFSSVIILVTGTIFAMWLGEKITDRGIGNGISLLIMVGIIASLPLSFAQEFVSRVTENNGGLMMILIELVLWIVIILLSVLLVMAVRRIPVQYARRSVGGSSNERSAYGSRQYIPLRLNASGVMPIIFAQALMFIPAYLGSAIGGSKIGQWLQANFSDIFGLWYNILFAVLIIIFTYFYTAITVPTNKMSDDLKRSGGFVPGIRPGEATAEYIDFILTRLTVIGAIYLSAVCLLPELLISRYAVPFYLGGTSLLIVVTVTMDLVAQVHSHLIAHQYEGLIKKAKLRGRI